MINFAIVTLGHIKHKIDVDRIRSWSSKLFRVSSISTCQNIPDGRIGWQAYTDDDLSFVRPATDADITVAITEYALEGNFYIRHTASGVIVMSFYEVGDLLEWQSIPLEHFVIRNLYELGLIFQLYGRLVPTRERVPDIIHDETRSCLFDMNGLKSDVVFSTAHPSVCDQCRARLSSSQLPSGTLRNLERELRRIRKPLYYRIAGFVRQRPVLSLCIAATAGFLLNVLANVAYDVLKRLFEHSCP